MCIYGTISGVYMEPSSREPSQTSSRRVSSFKDSSALLNNYYDELHKSEVPLISSTRLVVTAENIFRNTIKMHKKMETELSH